MIAVTITALDAETGDSVQLYTGTLDVPKAQRVTHKRLRALARAVEAWVQASDNLEPHFGSDGDLLEAWAKFKAPKADEPVDTAAAPMFGPSY